jgi:mycothiol synthase
LLEKRDYDPALNLVVVAPDGALVAFCECSISAAPGGPRTGWLDHLGTHPAYQQRGLGRAVTLAALHRIQAAGVARAMLVTAGPNSAAQHLYTTLGFTPGERERCYGLKLTAVVTPT